MRGRRLKVDSRADELCRALDMWNLTNESRRPSLRALARQLSTSHELLRYYLARLEKRKYKEVSRVAEEEAVVIRNRANAENRELTGSELQQLQTLDVRSFRALLGVAALDSLDRLKQAASRGPMHRPEYKMLEVLVKSGVPGALELWEKRVEIGLKPKKIFAAIVKDTSRQNGEAFGIWLHRIWDECDKYVQETWIES